MRLSLARLVPVLALAAAAASVAAAPAGAAPQLKLTPSLDCIDVNGDGSITAHFGYENIWTNQVNIPAGKGPPGQQNWFLPAPADRGQPSQFLPGTHSNVFTVTFTSSTLEWRLGDVNGQYNSVVADASDARCTPVPAAGVDSPWPVLLGVIGLAAFLAMRRRLLERAL